VHAFRVIAERDRGAVVAMNVTLAAGSVSGAHLSSDFQYRQEFIAMTTKTIKVPGPAHPITIERNPARVVVSIAGRVVADSRSTLTMREATLPAVQYIPRSDVDMSLLQRTTHATYCPYKGDCAYYSIPSGGERALNAVWTYEQPYAAVAEIKDHLAFYPSRVDSIEQS
jgi:uncharacterized protein (DUF427 family)